MSEKLLILNADDFGMCHSTNLAIRDLLVNEVISSTSFMVTCPWALEAAEFGKSSPEMDVGIHITHTSEWNHYKWGPVNLNCTTLTDDFGYFFPDVNSLLEKADPEELRAEAVAQVELSLKMGIDPTNIDNHMLSLGQFAEILLELCDIYHLPLRYARNGRSFVPNPNHEQIVKQADQKGILLPDNIEGLPFFLSEGYTEPAYEYTKEAAIRCIKGLKPGITELVFHPSLDTDELKAITNTWPLRRHEYDVFRDEEIIRLMNEEGINRISWRTPCDMQRGD